MKRSLMGTCALFALFAATLVSQNRAALVGTITDASGAVIAAAPVELKSLDTGALFKTTTSSTGVYSIPNLPPGNYELTVAVTGFKTYIAELIIGTDRVQHNVVLEVGTTADSVTVTDSAAVLKTESAQLAQQGQAQMRVNGMPMLYAGAPYQRFPDGNRDDRRGRSRPVYPPNAEEYGHWVENEFATVGDAPLSTFGVDVDTASYANVRRMLHDRQLPPPESVRIEELVNYFTYAYPPPERGKPVSLTANVLASPWNHGRLLLHIGLRTQPLAAEDLPPSNLTFLVDVSGSMNSPDKLPLVQQALQMLVRQLRKQDRVSLVVYAGSSGVVLPPTSGDRRDVILEAIGRLQAGGSTHGSAGIRLAYEMARQSFRKNGNNRVILATDGDFNVGVTSDDELVHLIEDERKSGVFLSVLGFGTGNLKDAKMEKLADHGNGNYAYIDSLNEARKVFVEEMGATLVTVAKDVKLQIEFNPARVKSYRLIGYENRLLRPEDFNDDTKDAGDLGAGHQVTAFYEIVPTGAGAAGEGVDPLRYQTNPEPPPQNATHSAELAWVKLRYKAPQSGTSELLEWPVGARVTPFDGAPDEVRFAAAVAEYGMLLRHSQFAGSASFSHALHTATDALGPDLNGLRTDFLDLVRTAAGLTHEHR